MNIKDAIKNTLPRYECELPVTKVKSKFRPFLVKEEKKLLILEETATQSEIYNGIIEVLNSCFDDQIDFSSVPLFEVEYCFLKLRSKSVGELINPKIVCPITGESHTVTLDLNQINLNIKNVDKIIRLTDSLTLAMKYPTIKELIDENTDVNNLIVNCIDYFEDNNQRIEKSTFKHDELMEFLDNTTSDQYRQIVEFFENMPSLEIKVEYMTSDGTVREMVLRGIKDFFS